jgi:tRNA 2-selenouridine synthase
MAVKKIDIDTFLTMQNNALVLDVRSEGEFELAHILGAYSLPLFNNEERKIVGTDYKQKSREQAIKVGLDFFGVKMRGMVEQVEQLLQNHKQMQAEQGLQQQLPGEINIVVHCWRGGMRSAAVAWLLDLYGFNVHQLIGGYKAYRQWVRAQFEKAYAFVVIGGYTGSGKTEILHALQVLGRATIDLEGLAHHKGSAFGALGLPPQPTQEMFENKLATALSQQAGSPIFIEDESQRIGNIQIPMPLWYTIRSSKVLFIEIPFAQRLENIVAQYGKHAQEQLVSAVLRIQKRLGGLDTKIAVSFLLENRIYAAFDILLQYYDKQYGRALNNRALPPKMLQQITAPTVDATQNAIRIHETIEA